MDNKCLNCIFNGAGCSGTCETGCEDFTPIFDEPDSTDYYYIQELDRRYVQHDYSNAM